MESIINEVQIIFYYNVIKVACFGSYRSSYRKEYAITEPLFIFYSSLVDLIGFCKLVSRAFIATVKSITLIFLFRQHIHQMTQQINSIQMKISSFKISPC